MTNSPTITQADRERGARWARAFALHREQAVAEKDARIAELEAALRPFVEGYEHTNIFLRTQEKMHEAGRDLYRQDVERARQALEGRADG